MKIKMKEAAHHRLSSGKSQSFKAGNEYDVPKATADALIERDVAVKVSVAQEKEK